MVRGSRQFPAPLAQIKWLPEALTDVERLHGHLYKLS